MIPLNYCQTCAPIVFDTTRATILKSLMQNSPQTVNELVTQFPLRQPTISHHLDLLKRSNFVSSVKKGNKVLYSVNLECHKNNKTTCVFLEPV